MNNCVLVSENSEHRRAGKSSARRIRSEGSGRKQPASKDQLLSETAPQPSQVKQEEEPIRQCAQAAPRTASQPEGLCPKTCPECEIYRRQCEVYR